MNVKLLLVSLSKLAIVGIFISHKVSHSHTINYAHYDAETASLHVPSVSSDSLKFFDLSFKVSSTAPDTWLELIESSDSVDPRNTGNFFESESNILFLNSVMVGAQKTALQFLLMTDSGIPKLKYLKSYNDSHCARLLPGFKPYTGLSSPYCGSEYLHIDTLTGLPNLFPSLSEDKSNVGITSWILRVPVPYHYKWRIPLNPTMSDQKIEASPRGPIAVAINGVPIFHYERRPDGSTLIENYNARSDTVIQGELDQCGGHAGQGDDYHYHYAPVCLLDIHDLAFPIAFSLDGIPIYYGTGGTNYYGQGRYNAINNLPQKPLDDCNFVTMPNGEQRYYTTAIPPYIQGCHRAYFDESLQIEPGVLKERRQGQSNSYGGKFGEASTTVVTDFYVDADQKYHFEHQSFDGLRTSSVIYFLIDRDKDCWEFEYRNDRNLPGEVAVACRN